MARLVAQRDREPVETGGVGRQAKSQEVIGPVETSAQDVSSRQRGMQLRRIGMPGKPKQRRTSGDRKSSLYQNLIKFTGLLFKLAARVICPWLIAERRGADQQCRSGAWPWTQRRGNPRDDVGFADGKAETQSGQAIELPERTQ